MEREKCSVGCNLLQNGSSQNLRDGLDLKIREREVRTRLPCRILRFNVDLAWGTWQRPAHV